MTRTKPGITNPALLLAFVSFFGLSQAALAAPCTDQVDALKAAMTDGICDFSKACDGLSHKLDNANHKLEQGKFRHAARRLSDFGAIVEDMAMRRKPMISMDDYEALMNPFYNAAANCISNGGVINDTSGSTDDGSSNDDTGSEGEPADDPFDGQMF